MRETKLKDRKKKKRPTHRGVTHHVHNQCTRTLVEVSCDGATRECLCSESVNVLNCDEGSHEIQHDESSLALNGGGHVQR